MPVSHKSEGLKSISVQLLAGVVLLTFSQLGVCYDISEERYSFSNSSAYGADSGPLPTRLLDDEKLFMAAAAERDMTMSSKHKRSNYQWLCNYGRNKYEGMGAVRKLLRMSFKNYRSSVKSASEETIKTTEEPSSQFTNIENYHLKVSDDKLMFGFEYKF